jgi:hypothetical protein
MARPSKKPKKLKPVVQEEKFSSLEESIRRRSAERAAQRDEEHWELRKKFVSQILTIFVRANLVVLACVGIGIAIDIWNATSGAQYFEHRIFDKEVLLGLIAAITVQLGAISLVISNWLFK